MPYKYLYIISRFFQIYQVLSVLSYPPTIINKLDVNFANAVFNVTCLSEFTNWEYNKAIFNL